MVVANEPQVVTCPMGDRAIKPLFQSIVKRGYDPRPPERARTLVLAPRKHGKSTFGCSCPTAVVADWEGGADAVVNPKALVVPIKPTADEIRAGKPMGSFTSLDPWDRWAHLVDLLLQDSKSGKPQFTTVCVDTGDFMLEYLNSRFAAGHNKLSKKLDYLGDYKDGKAGWSEARQPLFDALETIENAGFGTILLCHQVEEVTKDANGNITSTTWKWQMPAGCRLKILQRVDQIIHLQHSFETVKATKDVIVAGRTLKVDDPANSKELHKVVLRTIPTKEQPERGCRVNIPDQLVIPEGDGWNAYAAAYQAEVARQKVVSK